MLSHLRSHILGGLDPFNLHRDSDNDERHKVLESIESPGKSLKVQHVDLLKEKNEEEHHTEEYEQEYLVLRRGRKFELSITFDRDINVDDDSIVLQLTFGHQPQESKRTVIRMPLHVDAKSTDKSKTWSCIAKKAGPTITCHVTSPPNCHIGFYTLYVESSLDKNEESLTRYKLEDHQFAMIFNPWCKDDDVYMEEEEKREEYVMNQSGKLWTGTDRFMNGVPWDFGQFQEPCLDVALQLLDNANLSVAGRASVISIVRCLSALSNSNDDNGVLQGRWAETFPNGTNPSSWTGSVGILKEYHETKKSVKYGQCWVFSAIVTTMCRALGIPTRSITNFRSAHDTDSSMTIDKHIDEDDQPLGYMDDSVWNYHVWNESWFRRKDLPEGYDGWQAHDGTPQEKSEGVFQCGPASVRAIKEGHVYLNYDAKFIFAEVNGDAITWRVKKDGSMEVIQIDTASVGTYIMTGAADADFPEVLRHNYKYPDGSEKEREIVAFVNRFSTREVAYESHNGPKLIALDIEVPKETLLGDDMEIQMSLKNLTKERQAIKATATVQHIYYTGIPASRVKTEKYEKEIEGGKEGKLTMKIIGKDYEKGLHGECQFNVVVVLKDANTGQTLDVSQTPFTLKRPAIQISAPDEVPINKEVTATIHFKNTTKIKLTNVSIQYQGSGLRKPGGEKHKDLAPGDELRVSVHMNAKKKNRNNRYELVVSLTSDQVGGIRASKKIRVKS